MNSHPRQRSGMRTFTVIWAGQLVSLIGSGLSGFALGVYLFQLTGAATLLALFVRRIRRVELELPDAAGLGEGAEAG